MLCTETKGMGPMLERGLLASLLFLVGIQGLSAQTVSAPAKSPAQGLIVPTARMDPVDVKIQDALRERDAIIRNLLERVQELEDRLNAGNVEVAHAGISTKAAAVPVAAVKKVDAVVVNNSSYDEEERRATESLDQALLVRGGLLLPNGTLEVDNTASYFSLSSDHLTVDGFALLPVLVVGDITSQRLRRDILIHSLTTRLGLPKQFQMDFTVPYGYVLNRRWTRSIIKPPRASSALAICRRGYRDNLLSSTVEFRIYLRIFATSLLRALTPMTCRARKLRWERGSNRSRPI